MINMKQHETVEDSLSRLEISSAVSNTGNAKASHPSGSFILLAACQPNETLPLNSGLPADLFTACLTTPIRIALKWLANIYIYIFVHSFT